MRKKIIIGSRGSKLALIYAKKAKEELLKYLNDYHDEQIIIKEIVTTGDEVKDKRLSGNLVILPCEETTASSIVDLKINLLALSIFCSRTSLTGLFSIIFDTTTKSSSNLAGAIYLDDNDFTTKMTSNLSFSSRCLSFNLS